MTLFVDPKADYRPDIDGMRAIAVLSVIVFHIDGSLLPGGFIGVDIFFVISGFLISRNIMAGIQGGDFSIIEFYRRRVKRIAPAMLVVIFPTLVLAQIVLLPEDAAFTAESALWATLSLSNVFFWLNLDTSYFAAASNETPLLHLWSLGVEEQFYLFWPILLTLVYRPERSRTLFLCALAAALISFMFAELVFFSAPSFTYYMLPTRIGELLLGALVAIAIMKGADRALSTGLTVSMGWFGALAILVSLAALSEYDVFPGLRAIPPTAGTAVIILAGHRRGSRLARFLAFKPLVWVGLISYSAYLWHWPLLAFARYGHNEITAATAATVFSATMLLAWITYRYVEQPARRATAPASKIFLRQYIVPGGALALLSLFAAQIDGYGIRYASEKYRSGLEEIRSRDPAVDTYGYVCLQKRVLEEHLRDENCVLGPGSQGTTSVILWGDSNAAHYIGMLGAFAKEAGFRFRNLAVGRCPGIFGDLEPFVTAQRLADCRASHELARPVIDRFDVVILSSSWTEYGQSRAAFLNAAMNTAGRLARTGKLVILLGKVPPILGYDRRCREKSLSYPFLDCPNPSGPVLGNVVAANAELSAFAARTRNVAYFDATDYLCPEGVCRAFDSDGTRLYYDTFHLTMKGSWRLGEEILRRDGLPAPFALIKNRSRHLTANRGFGGADSIGREDWSLGVEPRTSVQIPGAR